MKEKGLMAGGVVAFQRSFGPEKQLYIECRPGEGKPMPEVVQVEEPAVQVIRLFGVDMFQVPAKRKELELLPVVVGEFAKRQCVREL